MYMQYPIRTHLPYPLYPFLFITIEHKPSKGRIRPQELKEIGFACLKTVLPLDVQEAEAADMNGRFQMQGGKNWILPK
jgi:hypothetical protein